MTVTIALIHNTKKHTERRITSFLPQKVSFKLSIKMENRHLKKIRGIHCVNEILRCTCEHSNFGIKGGNIKRAQGYVLCTHTALSYISLNPTIISLLLSDVQFLDISNMVGRSNSNLLWIY